MGKINVNENLIEEARAFASASPLGKPIAREMDKAILMVRRLAVALEAALAARQPTEDGEGLLAKFEEFYLVPGEDLDPDYDRDGLIAGLQAVAWMGRAAVPDAATELHPLPENGCDKQAHDTMNRNINRVFENNMSLVNELEAMKAERDAALAAVERVRAEAGYAALGESEPHNDWNSAMDYVSKRILAALDGAPEPEWEYGCDLGSGGEPREHSSRSAAESDASVTSTRTDRNGVVTEYERRIVRRRKAGPWLPVEGEKP